MMRPAWLLLCLVLTVSSGLSHAGEPKSPKVHPDSTAKDSAVARKAPIKAVFFSAVFPGGGQIYTGNYWRAVGIGTAETGLAGAALYEVWKMNKATDQAEVDRHFEKQRSLWWWTAGVWAFSMADAYVGAHLYRFDDQGKVAIRVNSRRGLALVLTKDV